MPLERDKIEYEFVAKDPDEITLEIYKIREKMNILLGLLELANNNLKKSKTDIEPKRISQHLSDARKYSTEIAELTQSLIKLSEVGEKRIKVVK